MVFFEKYTAHSEANYRRECLAITPKDLTSPEHIPISLKLHEDTRFVVFYAPMSITLSANARVLIVGLTPGWAQAKEAYAQYKASDGNLDMYRKVSKSVAFKGPMRAGIYDFFQKLGINQHLGITTREELFDLDSVVSTSILRYPVYLKRSLNNYSGSDAVLKNDFFAAMVQQLFLPLLLSHPEALIVPMGKWPDQVLKEFAKSEPSISLRVLWDFPHMSGANNGLRVPSWDGHHKAWLQTIAGWKSF